MNINWLAVFGAAQALAVLIPFAVELSVSAVKGYVRNKPLTSVETAAVAAAAFLSAASMDGGWPSNESFAVYIVCVPLFAAVSTAAMALFLRRRSMVPGIVYAVFGCAVMLVCGVTVEAPLTAAAAAAVSALHAAAVSMRTKRD